MKDKRFHNQVDWCMFGFSVLVIWVHSWNLDVFSVTGHAGISYAVKQIEVFFSDTLGQIAVPGFFMVSAYLFYRNFYWGKLWDKWKRRSFSLIIPYLLWNALYYLLDCVLSAVTWLSGLSGVSGVQFSIPNLVHSMLHYTYNPVFWYMQQLILLTVLAPVVYGLLKYRWSGILALAAVCACICIPVDLPLINEDALLYYMAAAYVALHGKSLIEEEHNPWLCRAAAMLCFLAAIPWCLGSMWLAPLPTVLFRFGVAGGICLLLSGICLPETRPWMRNTFFLYAIHFLVVRSVNKIGAFLLPESPVSALVLYAVCPAAAIGAAWIGRMLLKRWMPPVWSLLTGNR